MKEDVDDIVLVGGSTRIPRVQAVLSEYFNFKTLTFTINPDQSIACGAAIHGAMIEAHGAYEVEELN